MSESEQAKDVFSLSEWSPRKEDLDDLERLTERSLKEVKELTEYEDQKAQRILAAIAFLAALGGGVFTIVYRSLPTPIPSLEVALVYLFFTLFALCVTLGSALVVWAIKPRFKIPKGWASAQGDRLPKSFLFFEKIIELDPTQWAHAFTRSSVDHLRAEYIKNAILETHLVAQKISDKMRWLQPGVGLLWISILILTGWIPLAVSVVASTAPLSEQRPAVASEKTPERERTLISNSQIGSLYFATSPGCFCPGEARGRMVGELPTQKDEHKKSPEPATSQ